MWPLAITSKSLEKMLARISPRKNEKVPIKHAIASEMPIPDFSESFARFNNPAPMFCATKALKLCEIADGMSIINPQTFSATPTPADAISPKEFTTV